MSLDPAGDDASVLVHYWGTRGSIPSPGPETVVYGGNTPCVEVRAAGRRWIFDGGTGIRSLGAHLSAAEGGVRAVILLSHYHWDHIHGLPFFSPLYKEGTDISVFGPRVGDVGPEEMMAVLMGPAYFPISCDHVQAKLETRDLEPVIELDGAAVHTLEVRHAPGTVGFRLEVEGRRICYVPDNELMGGHYDLGADWRQRMEAFVQGADLLIHDAMFVAEEYEHVEGWGHSTVEQAVDLATSAGVKRLALFHHAPDRADSDLIDIVSKARRSLALGGASLKVWAARENETDVL